MEAAVKAVAIQSFGSPGGLAVIDLPDPEPAGAQVLITTEAVGVGGVDAMILSGALAAYGFREGHVLGGEIAGTVAAVGDGVDASWVGQRVWAFTGTGGGYAEQAIAPASTLIPLPAGLPTVDAVTLGSSGAVAHFGLRHARFAPGESVLLRGGAGGIGIMTVQLAARGGASAVAVTTSSVERADRLRALGATHVLDRDGQGGQDAPAGYDVIIDVAAGPAMASFFARLNPNGRMVAVGAVAGDPPADFGMEMFAAFQKSMSFATFSAATVPDADRRAATAELFAAAGRGELRSVVHEVLPLSQAAVAHQKMAAGEVFGRIVLTPAGSDHPSRLVLSRWGQPWAYTFRWTGNSPRPSSRSSSPGHSWKYWALAHPDCRCTAAPSHPRDCSRQTDSHWRSCTDFLCPR
jgi:NADPH2:quinone reductase